MTKVLESSIHLIIYCLIINVTAYPIYSYGKAIYPTILQSIL